MTEDQLKLVEQWLLDAREWMLARTVPILAWARDGLPVLQGSGILLKVADAGFLVSAAHVLTDVVRDGRGLFIGLADGVDILSLEGLDTQVSTDERDIDVAFVRLPPELDGRISQHRPFLRLDQVDTARRSPEKGLYIVAGFPRRDTQTDGSRRVIDAKPFCLSTTLYDGDWDDFTVGTSIVLSYTRMVIDERGDLARPPPLEGVSGCGIWRVVGEHHPTPGHWDVTSIRLAGIEHSVVGPVIKGLLAFRLVDWIRQNHPDLAPAIDRARAST